MNSLRSSSLLQWGTRVAAVQRSHYATQSGNIQDIPSFLTAIGRKTMEYAPKLKDKSMQEFLAADASQLKEWGVANTNRRRYILKWISYYKSGVQPWAIELTPKPQRGPKWRY